MEKKEGYSRTNTNTTTNTTVPSLFIEPMAGGQVRTLSEMRSPGLPINPTTVDLFINYSSNLLNFPLESENIHTAQLA